MFNKSSLIKFSSVVNGVFYVSSMMGAQTSSAVKIKDTVANTVTDYIERSVEKFYSLTEETKDGDEKNILLERALFGKSLFHAAKNVDRVDEFCCIFNFSNYFFGLEKQNKSSANNSKSMCRKFVYLLKIYTNTFMSYIYSSSLKEKSVSINDYNLAVFNFFKKLKEHKENFKENEVEDATELLRFHMSFLDIPDDTQNIDSLPKELEYCLTVIGSDTKISGPVLRKMLEGMQKIAKNVYNLTGGNPNWSKEKRKFFSSLTDSKEISGKYAGIAPQQYMKTVDMFGKLNEWKANLNELKDLILELIRDQKDLNSDKIKSLFAINEEKHNQNEINNINNINNITNNNIDNINNIDLFNNNEDRENKKLFDIKRKRKNKGTRSRINLENSHSDLNKSDVVNNIQIIKRNSVDEGGLEDRFNGLNTNPTLRKEFVNFLKTNNLHSGNYIGNILSDFPNNKLYDKKSKGRLTLENSTKLNKSLIDFFLCKLCNEKSEEDEEDTKENENAKVLNSLESYDQ